MDLEIITRDVVRGESSTEYQLRIDSQAEFDRLEELRTLPYTFGRLTLNHLVDKAKSRQERFPRVLSVSHSQAKRLAKIIIKNSGDSAEDPVIQNMTIVAKDFLQIDKRSSSISGHSGFRADHPGPMNYAPGYGLPIEEIVHMVKRSNSSAEEQKQ